MTKKEKIVRIVLVAAFLVAILVYAIVDWSHLTERFQNSFTPGNIGQLWLGFGNTMLITLIAFILGVVLGMVTCLVLGLNSQNWFVLVLKDIFRIYVSIFRGTPMVVQLLIIYFIVFASYTGNAMFIAILSFGMNSGAYVSEIIRGGINAVPKGQSEASRSLGLSYSQSMLRVVLPQAIRNAFPSLCNEFITLIKETSIVGFIAAFDLTLAFRKIANASFDYATVYIVMGITYFILVLLFTTLFKYLERWICRGKNK